jgi:nucleotide-binding universal stress UspA family protein
MNILVATDGTLDPQSVADAVARFYQEQDSVCVMTAVNVPVDFLRGLGDGGVQEAAQIAHEAGATLGAGDRAAEQLAPIMPVKERPDTDSLVSKALADAAEAQTKPVVEALKAKGIESKAIWRTTENKTARTIMATMKELESDIVIIGSHGHGKFEGLLGSTGTKLVRLAPAAVLVLRGPAEGD